MNWKQAVLDLETKGWTLTALAAHVGLSISALSDIKQGRTKEPLGMAAVRLYEMTPTNSRRRPKKKRAA